MDSWLLLCHPRSHSVIPGVTGDPGVHGFPVVAGNDVIPVIPDHHSVIPGLTGDPGGSWIPAFAGMTRLDGFPLKPALDLIGGGKFVIPGRCLSVPATIGDPGAMDPRSRRG